MNINVYRHIKCEMDSIQPPVTPVIVTHVNKTEVS